MLRASSGKGAPSRTDINSKYEEKKTVFTHAELYDIIVLQDQIRSVFPNLDIAFRIFLTFMLTNVSAERSFSRLKRIKNPYRTTMTQERLDSLSLLCIESDCQTCFAQLTLTI